MDFRLSRLHTGREGVKVHIYEEGSTGVNLGSWLRSVGREPLLLRADCSAAVDGGVMPWLAMQEVTTRSIISASTDGERARDCRSKCTLDS